MTPSVILSLAAATRRGPGPGRERSRETTRGRRRRRDLQCTSPRHTLVMLLGHHELVLRESRCVMTRDYRAGQGRDLQPPRHRECRPCVIPMIRPRLPQGFILDWISSGFRPGLDTAGPLGRETGVRSFAVDFNPQGFSLGWVPPARWAKNGFDRCSCWPERPWDTSSGRIPGDRRETTNRHFNGSR